MILMNSYFSESYGRTKFGTIYFRKWFRHKSWTQLQCDRRHIYIGTL